MDKLEGMLIQLTDTDKNRFFLRAKMIESICVDEKSMTCITMESGQEYNCVESISQVVEKLNAN